MDISLAYGKKGLPLRLDEEKYDIEKIAPKNFRGLKNPRKAFTDALENMSGSVKLEELRKKAFDKMRKMFIPGSS